MPQCGASSIVKRAGNLIVNLENDESVVVQFSNDMEPQRKPDISIIDEETGIF